MGARKITPEGKIKAHVKILLKKAGAYYHCPVQNGMGAPALDFHVCLPVKITPDMVGKTVGMYLGIETKAPGKKPTARQLLTAKEITAAHGEVAIIDGIVESLIKRLEG